MRTLVVEPNTDGHHFQAVGHVARLALADGPVVLLTSRGARATDDFAIHLGTLTIDVDERLSGTAPTTRELVAAVAAAIARHGADTVVVMDGDVPLKSWWWRAGRAFASLDHRPQVDYFLTRYPARVDPADWRHWRLRIAKAVLVLLGMLTGVIHRASGFASRDESPGGWIVHRAVDPALCSATARDRTRIRDELGLPADRRFVGVFGGINVRKDLPLVLAATLATGPDVDLVLAGPFDDAARAWLAQLSLPERRRVQAVDGCLPDAVLDRYLASADVVALMMTLEGPSGIQGKALAAGVPVVSAGSRTRARELAATGGGIATQQTQAAVATALRAVLAAPDAFVPSADGLPSAEDFARTILGTPHSAGGDAAAPVVSPDARTSG